NRSRRGMNTALCFGCRNSLHSMNTALKTKLRVDFLSRNKSDDLFVSTGCTLAQGKRFHFPANGFSITRVHAIEVRCKKRSLFPSFPTADFQDGVFLVVRIRGEQQDL